MNQRAPAEAAGPVAIICGGGSFPFTVAETLERNGRRVVLFPLNGWADSKAVERYPHYWANLGQFGRFVRIARKEGCRDVIFIGSLLRPAIRQLVTFDWETLRLLPRVARQFYGGDNHLLTGIARIFEDYGFRLLGAHEVAPDILVKEGALGGLWPKARDYSDIARGLAALRAIGPFDVGQAIVVANNNVLALEAAEGTDQMLSRIADMRQSGRIRIAEGMGVLIKAPKPDQDRRFDLPSIGPRTIEGAAAAGLAGIAVIAGSAIVAEPEVVIKAADHTGLFVAGVREEP